MLALAVQHPLKAPQGAHDALPPALASIADPVDATLSVLPNMAAELAQLVYLLLSNESVPRWMVEGDKMRLRREDMDWIDLSGRLAEDTSEPAVRE